MRIRIRHYEIRPYKDTCWEIWEYIEPGVGDRGPNKDKAIGDTWRSRGSYPTYLSSALKMVWELLLKEDGVKGKPAKEDAIGIHDAMERARALADEVIAAVPDKFKPGDDDD